MRPLASLYYNLALSHPHFFGNLMKETPQQQIEAGLAEGTDELLLCVVNALWAKMHKELELTKENCIWLLALMGSRTFIRTWVESQSHGGDVFSLTERMLDHMGLVEWSETIREPLRATLEEWDQGGCLYRKHRTCAQDPMLTC